MVQRPRFSHVFFLLVLALAVTLSLPAPSPAQSRGNLPPDLRALVAEALQANPEIKQMGSTFKASKETIRSAGALDDPEGSFSINNLDDDSWSFKADPMTQKMLELSQKFPFPGKRRLRSEVAAEQAQSDQFSFQEKVNEVRARVVTAYWNLSLAYSDFDLTQRGKQAWEQVVKVAETRYAVGQGMQTDVLQAQVELGNYLDRLFQWTQKQESSQADLNALRAKPPQTAIGRPQPLKPRPFNLKLDELLARSEARPQLQALKALIAKQEKAVSLAKKDYFPDMTVGVNYAFRENLNAPLYQKQPNMVGGRVMFNLPIWQADKIKPRIREEMAKQDAAKEGHRSAADQLAAAIKDRHAKLQRLAKQISLFDQGIIPQARQAAAASLSSYQVGTVPFNQLYQNQIAVYNTEMQLQEYLKDFEENWAELEWLVGAALPRPAGGKQ